MKEPRILTIQDISCVGQCSLTVALPILSACGIETAVMPSAVLSTHTGGFSGFTFRDLTDDMPKIMDHWVKQGILFDAVYTGYLGSVKQISCVQNLFHTVLVPSAARIVDPAMADLGKLYYGFDSEFVTAMKSLCCEADIVLPNITEACLLTGIGYREIYDEAYINELISGLHQEGIKTVVLTGVGYKTDMTGVLVSEEGKSFYYAHRKLPKGCHGTGDIFASAFTGSLISGISIVDSVKIAADYTVRCIENTQSDPDHWYGSRFEGVIPELIEMIHRKIAHD